MFRIHLAKLKKTDIFSYFQALVCIGNLSGCLLKFQIPGLYPQKF